MDLEERRDLLNEKMAEQIEILPGQSLDEAQIAKFLKAIQGHLHEYLYQTALFMGLRQGEVLGLTWD